MNYYAEIGNLKIPAVKGDTGEQGEQGEAGKIVGLSVVMLDSSEEPYVKNNGTETEANLEFGIPKGDSIDSITINAESQLVILLASGLEYNLGDVVGTGIGNVKINDGYLIVTLTDGTQINAGELTLNTSDFSELKQLLEDLETLLDEINGEVITEDTTEEESSDEDSDESSEDTEDTSTDTSGGDE